MAWANRLLLPVANVEGPFFGWMGKEPFHPVPRRRCHGLAGFAQRRHGAVVATWVASAARRRAMSIRATQDHREAPPRNAGDDALLEALERSPAVGVTRYPCQAEASRFQEATWQVSVSQRRHAAMVALGSEWTMPCQPRARAASTFSARSSMKNRPGPDNPDMISTAS